MHYNTSYKDLPLAEKDAKALQDLRDYLGEERFADLTSRIKSVETPVSYKEFVMLMSLAGVEGYPVKAYYKFLYPNEEIPC